MPVLRTALEAAKALWRFHFRIPEAAYWVALAVTVVFFPVITAVEALVFALAAGVWVAGIARWRWHRRLSRGGLVVTRFSMGGADEGRPKRTQETIMSSLADKLPRAEMAGVHEVPVTVRSNDRSFAAQLRSRLRGRLLLYGRIEESAGEWAVFARVAQELPRGVIHRDWHTRDETPAKRSWGELVERLTPSQNVALEEYPFEFATELEAVVRGTAGQVALFSGDLPRAESFLSEALAKAPDSESHQLDQLRVDLSHALIAQDRSDEAIALLRNRAQGEQPSPHLLRHLAGQLIEPDALDTTVPVARRDEAVAALRRAYEYEADPQREMTAYNLAMLLGQHPSTQLHDEGVKMIKELYAASRWYSKTWWVRRQLGGAAWEDANAARDAGDEATAERAFREAAAFYSGALRRRPRFRLLWFTHVDGQPTLIPFYRFAPSPVLYANAQEAHAEAGHDLRSAWLAWRLQRVQKRLLRRALRCFAGREWEEAYANFDWIVTGRDDLADITAQVYRAVALQQMGQDAAALSAWEGVRDLDDVALIIRAGMREHPELHPLERGLPGDDEENLDRVLADLGMAPEAAAKISLSRPR